MRALVRAVLLCIGVTSASSDAASLVPKVLVDTFPAGFFESVDCSMLRRGQRLTVDPMSLPPGKTINIGAAETLSSTQAERRVMVQTKLYACTVDALLAIELALPRLTGTAYTTAHTKFLSAREGVNWPTTPGWEASSMLKYGQGVRNVLFYTAGPNLYALADDSYPWTYPDSAIKLLNDILAIFTQYNIPSPLTGDLQTFVTQTYSMAGHPANTSLFVSNENVYFKDPLTDATMIARLQAVEQLHADSGAALVCTYERAEALCPAPPDPARVACIRNTGIALGCPDPGAIHELEHEMEVVNAVTFGVPTIAPASRGIHPKLTLDDVCRSVQRAHYAYHDWMRLVRDAGHTLDGFHRSWMASLAHAQIHVERTLGMMQQGMPPLVGYDVTNPLSTVSGGPKGDFRMPYEIRKYVYADAPGVSAADGTCDAYWLGS